MGPARQREGERKKRGEARGWLCWVVAGLAGLASRAGPGKCGPAAASIFFSDKTFSSFFSEQQNLITFDSKLQMSSNHFQNICTNKIHSTRHTHLAFLKIKIMPLFRIE